MRAGRVLALLGLAALGLYLVSAGGLSRRLWEGVEAGRMKNVVLCSPLPEAASAMAAASEPPSPSPPPSPPETSPPPEAAPLLLAAAGGGQAALEFPSRPDGEEIRETTIQGGLSLKNETSCDVDLYELLRPGPPQRLPAEGPQILILHTHGSEAYTQAGLDRYESDDNKRTSDERCNIIRVGDELAAIFQDAGLRVLHDREIYDAPSYTGSYTRSGEAVARYLAEYPEIAVVLDIHRDALGSGDVIYKTMAEEEGVVASQVMLLAGSDDSGLEHPRWRENLALALYLQERVSRRHPTLMRPVSLVPQRYNQHLCTGSLILEVGSSGNTLQEALAAIRLFGEAAAPALLELTEPPPEA